MSTGVAFKLNMAVSKPSHANSTGRLLRNIARHPFNFS